MALPRNFGLLDILKEQLLTTYNHYDFSCMLHYVNAGYIIDLNNKSVRGGLW